MMEKHTFVVLAYKESKYLEECILSVINQDYKSNIILATSTPNDFISNMATKYGIDVVCNSNPGKGIGYDFDFAISCGKTSLVTVAHQDDIYEPQYAKCIIEEYQKNQDALILFSDYFELRDGTKVFSNMNLRIKRILLTTLKSRLLSKTKFGKRFALRFGCAICCPAVTFVRKNIPYTNIFACDFKCDVDWHAWEKLSKLPGKFVFINNCLMGHRVHEDSTTTEIISDNIRTKEDLIMFQRFWPLFIAKRLNEFYIKSENSNKTS